MAMAMAMAASVWKYEVSLIKLCGNNFNINPDFVRHASKKASGSTKNISDKSPATHRGFKKVQGQYVTAGTTVVSQYHLRLCPGLNVGYGKRGYLWAQVSGKVMVTCEKTNFDTEHAIVKKAYAGREPAFYKKYYHVIPDPQPQTFVQVDSI